MQNQAAQVTSSLLQFPEVTIKALQEDEINLDSVLRGKFTTGRTGLAWLACGPQLEVANSVTGERLSAYHFSGVTERPPTVVAVKEFSWQKKTGLLVGLVETEGSVLCLYDLGISRVVKAVVLPGSVTAIEPIINVGGASVGTQHLHQSLRWFFGVAAVVTNVGHVLLVDLCLDDVSSNQDELDASDLEVISGIPTEIPKLRDAATRERRHLCLQLLAPSGTTISTVSYISRTNQLAVGFSDGYLSLWNMKTLRREYHVQMEGGRVPVYAITFQEPENDPRNCCYLWAVQTSESGGDVSLHLLQMAFGDRKCLASGQILYENLEYCEERYSLDLSADSLSLRGQTSTKLLGCQTLEKIRIHGEREDGVHEVTSPDTSVSVFSWQVNTYGQGKPSIYLGVFDINRWYQAQMPDSLRPGQFLRNCSYFAFWSLEVVASMTQDSILDIILHERSLSRGVPPSYPPPEQYFFPSSYNFDGTCLLSSGVVHITCTGFQKETLHFLKNSGSSLNEAVPDGYNRCLVAGLLSPRLADVQPSSLSQEEQLQAVLSAAIETSSLGLLTSCIKRWTAEEQPRSAGNLRFVLEWTWNKVVFAKQEFDRLCVPLFDGSCNFIDPQTLQALHHCHQRFRNLATVLNCFLAEAQELTQKGLTDLTNKQSVAKLLTLYASVVLWFCRSGLLPDTADETMQLSRPYYSYQRMQQYYSDRRKKLEHLSRGKWNANLLMIDGMISQFGDRIQALWSREGGGTGKYPPASLHALLDLYLIEDAEEMSKHAITIYFLLDIMYAFPDKPDSSIESFPTAFSVPCGLIKLIQGFWLLDHNDYQNSVDCILHPAVNRVLTWQHSQIVETLMCQGDHRQALRYIQAMKPPITTSQEVKLHMTVLLANRYIVEAWNLQRLHSSRLNIDDLLKHMYETCQEIGLMEELLKFTFTDVEHDYLQRFLQTTGGVQNQELLLVHQLQRANYIPALQLNQTLKNLHTNDTDRRLRERGVARNSILDQYGKVLPRVQRTLAYERAKPYTLSSLVWREVSRPKPLSTIAKQAPGSVITKAHFISSVLSKIKEVSAANQKSEFSPCKSFANDDRAPVTTVSQDLDSPEAFVGTPITKSRRVSRLLDSVVHPVMVLPSPPVDSGTIHVQRTPRKSPLLLTSSPMESSLRKVAQMRSIAKASEFNLLETPLVVRRAKALATSTTSSTFAGFTPQSILRSSVRTTPLGSPSVSPGRSLTPPLRLKETKISFMEEIGSKYTKGVASSERDLLSASPVLRSVPDTLWTRSRIKMTSFAEDTITDKDHEEMEESSSGIQDESPTKMEVSRETSNVSIRSDQTTLEYHDAPTPEDLEEDTSMRTKPQSPVIERTVEEETKEVLKPEQNIESPQVTEVHRPEEEMVSEEAAVECVPCPENGPKGDEQLEKPEESELGPSSASEAKPSLAEVAEPESVSSTNDSQSVITIHDSEDIASTHSANLEGDVEEEDLNGDMEVFEHRDVMAVEEPSVTISHSVEIHLVQEKDVEIQVAERDLEVINYQELYPAAPLEIAYEDNLEHKFNSELVEPTDSAENELDDAEGEHFADQNNFTLVLEGDGGDEDVADMQPCSEAHIEPLTVEEPTCVTSALNKDVDLCEINHGVEASFAGTEQGTSVMEELPYVPENVKVTIAENLISVIKDTQNKNYTEESISDNETLRAQNLQASSKTPVKVMKLAIPEDNKSTGEPTTQKELDEPNDGHGSPASPRRTVLKPPTPRRSIRKSSRFTESTNIDSEELSLPTTPRRGRKLKENIENQDNAFSTLQEEELPVSVRITRKTRNNLTEKTESSVMEETAAEESLQKQPSTPTRTRRRKLTAQEEQENMDNDLDQKVSMPQTPTRMTRSRNTELEKVTSSQKEETDEPEPLPTTPTRGRRGKRVVNELVKHFELNASQPDGKQSTSPPASPKRVSLRWTRNKVATKTTEEEGVQAGEQTTDTPRKKPRKSMVNKLHVEEVTVPEECVVDEAQDDSVTVDSIKKANATVSVGRRGRKSMLPPVTEESLEERLQVPESQEKPGDEKDRTRITRTRSSNVLPHPDDVPVNFEFSTPTTKLKKKTKAQQAALSVSPGELEAHTSSQFVFSPPSTRTRRATRSAVTEPVKTEETKPQEPHETQNVQEEPVIRRPRGRPPKHKTKDSASKEATWSPPPVEIQLLSPPESPSGDVADTKTVPVETKAEQNTLRRNRRRIIMSKPVTRRKLR